MRTQPELTRFDFQMKRAPTQPPTGVNCHVGKCITSQHNVHDVFDARGDPDPRSTKGQNTGWEREVAGINGPI